MRCQQQCYSHRPYTRTCRRCRTCRGQGSQCPSTGLRGPGRYRSGTCPPGHPTCPSPWRRTWRHGRYTLCSTARWWPGCRPRSPGSCCLRWSHSGSSTEKRNVWLLLKITLHWRTWIDKTPLLMRNLAKTGQKNEEGWENARSDFWIFTFFYSVHRTGAPKLMI